MTPATPGSSSPLGYCMALTYCSYPLPMPDGSTYTFVQVQPTFGVATSPTTGATLPAMVSGRQCLAQATIRRLTCIRGGLPDPEIPTVLGNYGIDITDWIAADMSAIDVGQLSASADAQNQQDERVKSSQTAGTLVGDTLMLPILLTDGTGPFRLTLAIDVLTADLSVLSSPT